MLLYCWDGKEDMPICMLFQLEGLILAMTAFFHIHSSALFTIIQLFYT